MHLGAKNIHFFTKSLFLPPVRATQIQGRIPPSLHELPFHYSYCCFPEFPGGNADLVLKKAGAVKLIIKMQFGGNVPDRHIGRLKKELNPV